jgi:hypothetical protein
VLKRQLPPDNLVEATFTRETGGVLPFSSKTAPRMECLRKEDAFPPHT